ncbi:MAG: PHB depolymerase family esterase, partial [Casimicrobiaceae bacterium]
AQGTGIAAAADARGWVVLMPRQRESANAWSCWNWFDTATADGGGESAIVAAMVRTATRRHHVDRARVFAAGMSAGGALAAILGVRYPQLFRGVAVHSGIACGAARSAFTATSVMARGPEVDVAAIGTAAHDPRRRVALLAIHGLADNVVAPRNAAALARQYLALGAYPQAATQLPPADGEHVIAGARRTRVRDWQDQRGLVARLVEIDGLQHAWSGGDAALPFNDGAPPIAIDLIDQWLHDLASHSAKMGKPAGDEQ